MFLNGGFFADDTAANQITNSLLAIIGTFRWRFTTTACVAGEASFSGHCQFWGVTMSVRASFRRDPNGGDGSAFDDR